MMEEIDIGYICRRGHFQFRDDPDGDTCGPKDEGRIILRFNSDKDEMEELVAECLSNLHHKIEFWRKS